MDWLRKLWAWFRGLFRSTQPEPEPEPQTEPATRLYVYSVTLQGLPGGRTEPPEIHESARQYTERDVQDHLLLELKLGRLARLLAIDEQAELDGKRGKLLAEWYARRY